MTLSSTAIQSGATAGSVKSMGRLRVELSILGSPKRVDALTKATNRVKSIGARAAHADLKGVVNNSRADESEENCLSEENIRPS